MKVDGKVAVVTGAASGIGRATAVALARRGVRALLLADLDERGLGESASLVSGSSAEPMVLPTDVTKLPDLEAMYRAGIERFGGIDIVFNNAGIVSGPPAFPETAPERVRLVIEIDLIAVIHSTQIAIRHMKGRGGVIVNTSSTAGVVPLLSDAPYAAAKAGVIMFSRSCAPLRDSANIRVNAICPGVTDTAILEKTGGGKRPDWLAPILEHIEILQPEDVAAEVLRIVEDDSLAGEFFVLDNRPKVPA